jgi:hypothetical protein
MIMHCLGAAAEAEPRGSVRAAHLGLPSCIGSNVTRDGMRGLNLAGHQS